ncbi:MAG: YkuS family protein [Firmicutes bacterium]|nr:YkuS family protein [Bacillota bacterium]
MVTVAVSPALSRIKDFLRKEGIEVIDYNGSQSLGEDISALVVTGADMNMMGIQDIVQDIPVINVEGLTKEEVFSYIKQRLH